MSPRKSRRRCVSLHSLTFFLDRCLGKEPIRSRLRQTGAKVEVFDNHFRQDERDEIWLAAVAQRGWVVLTKDARIRRRPAERSALESSGAMVFILTSKNLNGEQIAQAFVKALPRICRMVSCHSGPILRRVDRHGRILGS